MKHLIVDGNNIANISFYRAKSVLEEEHKDDPDSVEKVLCSFSVNVFLNIFHMYLKDNKDYKIYDLGFKKWSKLEKTTSRHLQS